MTVTNSTEVETDSRSLLERWRIAKGEKSRPRRAPALRAEPKDPKAPEPAESPTYADRGAPVKERLRSMAGALEALTLENKMGLAKVTATTAQVFVDQSGRRRRITMVVSWLLSIILGLFIAMTLFGLFHALAVIR